MRASFWSALLVVLIVFYSAYFTLFSIRRHQLFYTHYFDLAIMHQTVYNSYQALRTGDFSRFLELTDPHGSRQQIKRLAIHNDIILALLAISYFIVNQPEVLLLIQTIVLASGAWAIYKIGEKVIDNKALSFAISFAYLMYPPMQRANIFDFHPVVLATSFLLFMYLFFLQRRYFLSGIFFILSLLTKEQVGLTTGALAIVLFALDWHKDKSIWQKLHGRYLLCLLFISFFWVFFSFYVIIPYFRRAQHFATTYYDDLITNSVGYLFHRDTFRYFLFLLGPVAFLPLFSPIFLVAGLPELAINLFSSNWNMRNIIFHYTAVIQPIIFIGAVYGIKKIIDIFPLLPNKLNKQRLVNILALLVILCGLIFSYFKSPLPYSREADVYPWIVSREAEQRFIDKWREKLANDDISLSASGHLAPHFASRRYLYDFASGYRFAEYVIIHKGEINTGYESEKSRRVYQKLKSDRNYQLIDADVQLEVYKRLER